MKHWIILSFVSALSAGMMLDELGWVDEPGAKCLGHFSVDAKKVQANNYIEFESSEASAWDGDAWVFEHPLKITHKDSQFDILAGRWDVKKKVWEFEQPSRLIHSPLRIISKKGYYDPRRQSAQLYSVQFRAGPTKDYHLALWGQAEDASWVGQETTLHDVWMSICSPKRPLWSLSAQEAVFKHSDNVMYLKHVVAKFFGIPIFYLPWLDLNLKRERASGFLSPQVYFNRNTFFFTVPMYWNIAPYFDATLAPLLSIQNQMGAMLQGRYLSVNGLAEGNGFFVKDADRHRYRLSSDVHLRAENWDIDIQGYQVSDASFVEDYPRFSQNISWLVPWSARGRMHNANLMLEGGIDSYQDFSPEQTSAVFAYYKRLPWVHMSGWDRWHDWVIKSSMKYGRYVPTASYQALLDPEDFVAGSLGAGTELLNTFGLWQVWGESLVSAVDDSAVANNARGLVSWQGAAYSGAWRWKTRLGFLLGSVSDNQTMPLLEGRPIVFNYDQLFQLNRFTLETRVGDYRDVDWSIEGQGGHWIVGLGSRYALRLHRVSVQESVTVYDPLLTQRASPWVTMASWQQGPWQVTSRINLGQGEQFQYSEQVNYQHKKLDLGLYAFKMPIDYPAYLTPEQVDNISGVGVLWNLKLTGQWRIKGEWFTQLSQSQSGYLLALRYQDCCLQFGMGVKRSLLPVESAASARTQWFAEIDFDTGSSIADTVL